MKNIIKASALILGVSTILTLSPMFKANAAEFTDRPTTAAAAFQNEIDDQIHAWREVIHKDDRDFEGFANLTILYYDKGDYAKSYKAADKALKLYEKYDISVDDDFLRETLVKGGASAYKLGKYRAAENMLTKMLSYDLKGSKENQDSYNGMAYYYLAALAKDEGDYNQSYIYINNAVHFCPSHHIFLDFLDGFFWLHDRWYWRHSHVHYISYRMPHHHHYYYPHHRHYKPVYHHRPATRAHVLPARDHVRAQAQRRVSAKPTQQHVRGPIRKTTTGQTQHQSIQRPVQRPQNHQNQGWRSSNQKSQQQQDQVQRPVQRPQSQQGQVQRPTQRPQSQQHQGWRSAQRPQSQQHQGWRPAQRPQAQQGQVQRPTQRPQNSQGQVQRPAQRPQPKQGQVQRSQSQNQQQPVYRPQSTTSRQSSHHTTARSSGPSRSSSGHSQGHYGRRH